MGGGDPLSILADDAGFAVFNLVKFPSSVALLQVPFFFSVEDFFDCRMVRIPHKFHAVKRAYGYQPIPSDVYIKECVAALIDHLISLTFKRHERGEIDRVGEANPVISETFDITMVHLIREKYIRDVHAGIPTFPLRPGFI